MIEATEMASWTPPQSAPVTSARIPLPRVGNPRIGETAGADIPVGLPSVADSPFRILIVCTANHCRSPIAEHLLRHQLEKSVVRDSWVITSSGTKAGGGLPMHPHARTVLRELGVDVADDWTSTALGSAAVGRAHLILTAETSHRQSVVALVPRAVRYTLPLLQFTALAGLVQPFGPLPSGAAGPELLRRALLARSRLPLGAQPSDNMSDPVGGDLDEFRRCAANIDEQLQYLFRPILNRSENLGPRRGRFRPDV